MWNVCIGGCNPTAVTKDQVVTVPSLNVITITAANHDVLAVAGVNGVNAAGNGRCRTQNQINVIRIKVGARHSRLAFCSHVVDQAIVAQDNVVTLADVNSIVIITTKDNVIAGECGDRVITTIIKLDRLDQSERHGLTLKLRSIGISRRDPAAVSDDQIVTITGFNVIAIPPADDDVISVTGFNGVYPTGIVGRGAFNKVNVAGVRVGTGNIPIPFLTHVVDSTVITKDDVVAPTGIDQISQMTAQNDVITAQGCDIVYAAVTKLDRLDQTKGHRLSGKLRGIGIGCRDPATVTNHQVVTSPSFNIVTEPAADDNIVASTGINDVPAAGKSGCRTQNQIDVSRISISNYIID